jgi:hypothetical protein
VDLTPFKPSLQNIANDIVWLDWILRDSVFNTESGGFHRDQPPVNRKNTTASEDNTSSNTCTLELDDKVFVDILAATHAMPS